MGKEREQRLAEHLSHVTQKTAETKEKFDACKEGHVDEHVLFVCIC